jgi:hypothetical protein
LGTITLEPDLKIIKDQQASSINNVRSINFGVDKASVPSDETKETKTKKSPEPSPARNKRDFSVDSTSSDSTNSSDNIHQKHQKIIKKSFQEPTVARAIPTDNLNHLLQVHKYSLVIDEKIFGTPIITGND